MSGLRPTTSDSAPSPPQKRNVRILSSASTSPPMTLERGLTASEPSELTMVEMTRASTGMVRPSDRYDSQLASTPHQYDGGLNATSALAATRTSLGSTEALTDGGDTESGGFRVRAIAGREAGSAWHEKHAASSTTATMGFILFVEKNERYDRYTR